MIDASRLYRPKELSRETGAPRDLLYQALHNGELKALRSGNRWLIPGRCVEEWLAQVAKGSP